MNMRGKEKIMLENKIIKTNVRLIKKSTRILFILVSLYILSFSIIGSSVIIESTNPIKENYQFFPGLSNDFRSFEDRSIVWDVRLNFSKLGGKTDFVYFGEASDANDGPPADVYDVAKPTPPSKNYIRAWFNDSLFLPYDNLERDYRHYPGNSKIWNLSVLWVPNSGTPPATITIVWNRTLLNMSEYNQIILQNETGVQVSDMRTIGTFTFINPANTIKQFKINCLVDTTPPEIINHSPDTGDTGDAFTFNATVIDDTTPANYLTVKVNWTHDGLFGNDTMVYTGGNTFLKTITLSNYSTDALLYHFYASDTVMIPNVNYTSQFSATITDDEPPRITNNTGSLEIGTGDSMILWAQTYDNIGVISAKITIDSIEYTMSWNSGNVRWEYLYTAPSDSLTSHSYTITVTDGALDTDTTEPFQITVFDNDPPVFSNILATPMFQLINGYVNLTSTIMDNINIRTVTVRITGPTGYTPVNLTLTGDVPFYYNQTYPIAGIYNYSFWGNDTSNNSDSSPIHQFTIFGELQITTLLQGWNFVSLPFNQTVTTANLFIVYGENQYNWSEAIAQGILLSSIFDWERNGQGYTLVSSLVPGRGYWLYSYQNCELWASGLNPMMSPAYVTSLSYRWNVFGVPINQPVNKTTLLFVYMGVTYNWTQATTNQNPTGGPLVLKDIFGWWRNTPQGYVLVNIFEYGEGYWIYAFYDVIIKRII